MGDPIQWKDKDGDPNSLIRQLNAIYQPAPTGGKTLNDLFEWNRLVAAIKRKLAFPRNVVERDQDIYCWKVINSVKGNITKDIFLSSINSLYMQDLINGDREYHVLTSISLDVEKTPRVFHVNDTEIVFVGKSYPKKYNSRNEFLSKKSLDESQYSSYLKVIIKVKANTVNSAYEKAFYSLDVLRGLICLDKNPTDEIPHPQGEPINIVRTGKFHTIHKIDGTLASDIYRYETLFCKCKNVLFENSKNKPCFSIKLLKRINRCKLKDKLYEAVVKYVRSFDETDQQISLIKMWSSLEAITDTSNKNNEELVKRASYIYMDECMRDILDSIRINRNTAVHGLYDYDENARDCYSMQVVLLDLIIIASGTLGFNSFEEFVTFLGLPIDANYLKKDYRLRKMALRFRR